MPRMAAAEYDLLIEQGTDYDRLLTLTRQVEGRPRSTSPPAPSAPTSAPTTPATPSCCTTWPRTSPLWTLQLGRLACTSWATCRPGGSGGPAWDLELVDAGRAHLS
jgi:hypothetical protein